MRLPYSSTGRRVRGGNRRPPPWSSFPTCVQRHALLELLEPVEHDVDPGRFTTARVTGHDNDKVVAIGRDVVLTWSAGAASGRRWSRNCGHLLPNGNARLRRHASD